MLLTTTEIARTLGIRTYQLAYAHQQGYIREPRRLGGRRVYGPDDLEVVQRYVEAQGLVGRRRGRPTSSSYNLVSQEGTQS